MGSHCFSTTFVGGKIDTKIHSSLHYCKTGPKWWTSTPYPHSSRRGRERKETTTPLDMVPDNTRKTPSWSRQKQYCKVRKETPHFTRFTTLSLPCPYRSSPPPLEGDVQCLKASRTDEPVPWPFLCCLWHVAGDTIQSCLGRHDSVVHVSDQTNAFTSLSFLFSSLQDFSHDHSKGKVSVNPRRRVRVITDTKEATHNQDTHTTFSSQVVRLLVSSQLNSETMSLTMLWQQNGDRNSSLHEISSPY
jgi:hypothetical protein